MHSWRNSGSGALTRHVDKGGELADVAQMRLLTPRFLSPFLLRVVRLFVLKRQARETKEGQAPHATGATPNHPKPDLNATQDVVVFFCDAHQLLFTAIFVKGLGRRQRLLHVHSLRMRHDVRHALQQQIIRALYGRVPLFIKLLTLQILKEKK